MTTTARLHHSPLGPLLLEASSHGIRAISFDRPAPPDSAYDPAAARHLDLLARELDAYFAGDLATFTVPLDPVGTDFRQRVWRVLRTIPHAETRSYLDIARAIGNPDASRAVGLANGANPIAIVVPCHRVIGSTGKLTGYAGELWRKQWLLEHEGVAVGKTPDLFNEAPAAPPHPHPHAPCTAAARYSLPC